MKKHGERNKKHKNDIFSLQQEQNKLLDVYWERNKYYQTELNRLQSEAQVIEQNIQNEKRKGKEMEDKFREKIVQLEKRLDNLNFASMRAPTFNHTSRKSRGRSREARKRELDAEGERIQQEIERVFTFCRSKPYVSESKYTDTPLSAPIQPKYHFVPINIPQAAQVNLPKYPQHDSFINQKQEDIPDISNLISSPKQSPDIFSPNISSPSISYQKDEKAISPVQSENVVPQSCAPNNQDLNNVEANKNNTKREDATPPKSRIPEVKKISITHSDDDSDFEFQSTHSPTVSQNQNHVQPALHFDDSSDSPSSIEGSIQFSEVDDIPQGINQEIGSETFHKFGFQTQPSNEIFSDNQNISETLPIQNTHLPKDPGSLQANKDNGFKKESDNNSSKEVKSTSNEPADIKSESKSNSANIKSSDPPSKTNSDFGEEIDDFNFEDDEFNLDGWADDD